MSEHGFTVPDLLVLLLEEASEVVQDAAKALRFGYEVRYGEYGQPRERLARELGQLAALTEALGLDQHPHYYAGKHEKLTKAEELRRGYGIKLGDAGPARQDAQVPTPAAPSAAKFAGLSDDEMVTIRDACFSVAEQEPDGLEPYDRQQVTRANRLDRCDLLRAERDTFARERDEARAEVARLLGELHDMTKRALAAERDCPTRHTAGFREGVEAAINCMVEFGPVRTYDEDTWRMEKLRALAPPAPAAAREAALLEAAAEALAFSEERLHAAEEWEADKASRGDTGQRLRAEASALNHCATRIRRLSGRE